MQVLQIMQRSFMAGQLHKAEAQNHLPHMNAACEDHAAYSLAKKSIAQFRK
jgi:hypothetical protein